MPRLTKAEKERAHLCTHPGCVRVWTTTFSGRKLCGEHAGYAPTKSIPTTEPVKPWADPERSAE
jgi:hypothetical protein